MDVLDILKDFNPKQQANGEIRMMCPFRERHDASADGSKSMFFNPEKNVYRCWSCGSKGSALQLLTSRFRVPYAEALTLVQWDKTITEMGKEIPKSSIMKAIDRVIDYTTPPQQFIERGFTPRLLKHFKVGSFLEDGKEIITIPYYDLLNDETKLVGLKYRVGRDFWYPVPFDKGNYLYNNKKEYTKPVLVEGETDLYRIFSFGYEVVSTLSASISDTQYSLLERFDTIYVATDHDRAGILARESLELHLGHKVNLLYVPYDADDPGKCTKEIFDEGMNNATDYAEYSLQMSLNMGEEYLKIKEQAKSFFDKSRVF